MQAFFQCSEDHSLLNAATLNVIVDNGVLGSCIESYNVEPKVAREI